MSLLNAFEVTQTDALVAKCEKRFISARDKLSQQVISSGPAYAMRWASDALEAEARYRAILEVQSFFTIEILDVVSAEKGREYAEKMSAQRVTDKLRFICAGTSSESEQVREAQAYAWAMSEFNDALQWAATEAKRAEQVQA